MTISTTPKNTTTTKPQVRVASEVKATINLGDYSNFTFTHYEERWANANERSIALAERRINDALVAVMEARLAEWREMIEGEREAAIGTT